MPDDEAGKTRYKVEIPLLGTLILTHSLVGILFPFLKDRKEHHLAMNTIAPVWNGNETWLVLGGGGLFAAVAQGMTLGALVQGITVEGRAYAGGGNWDCLAPFSVLTAVVPGLMAIAKTSSLQASIRSQAEACSLSVKSYRLHFPPYPVPREQPF